MSQLSFSEAEFAGILRSIGIPEGFAKTLAGFDVEASRGELFDDGKELSRLVGRPTTSLSDAVKKALA